MDGVGCFLMQCVCNGVLRQRMGRYGRSGTRSYILSAAVVSVTGNPINHTRRIHGNSPDACNIHHSTDIRKEKVCTTKVGLERLHCTYRCNYSTFRCPSTFINTVRSIACARKEGGSLAQNPLNNEGARRCVVVKNECRQHQRYGFPKFNSHFPFVQSERLLMRFVIRDIVTSKAQEK